jgi:hypothetical protein
VAQKALVIVKGPDELMFVCHSHSTFSSISIA